MLCRARRTDGEPCAAQAMRGGSVCRAHGGRAPQVRAAAARRLVDAELQQAVDCMRAKQQQAANEERARRAALEPWMDKLGPRPIWDLHNPKTLRAIAAEMRATAAELTSLAATSNRR